MRILIAPDSLKACLSATAVANAIADAVHECVPSASVDLCPLSDGGEGFVDALVTATGARVQVTPVTGPGPDQRVQARWALCSRPMWRAGDSPAARSEGGNEAAVVTAIIELAEASGYALAPARGGEVRNPAGLTTFGTGELLLAAVRAGAAQIILGIGGSATIDAGLGMCQAAGLTILRRDGEPVSVSEPLTAGDLPDIYLIKRGRGSEVDRVPIIVATDVTNPLHGPIGAAFVFGPQKGATAEQCSFFDGQHRALAERTHTQAQAETPGAGAAGGVGWAMLSFFNATLVSGLRVVSEVVDLEARVAAADLVITAEGRFDRTSLHDKLPVSVARLCRRLGKPCHLLAGRIAEDPTPYFATHQEISPAEMTFVEAVERAPELVRAATCRLSA